MIAPAELTPLMTTYACVSECSQIVLHNTPQNFIAGKTRLAFAKWSELTSDKSILSWVAGVTIDFENDIDQWREPVPIKFPPHEKVLIDNEVEKLCKKGIIEKTVPTKGQFVSNIFFRPKKDGSIRLILNLRNLNLDVEYHHFKMETLNHAIQLMSPNCYMASIDLKDAYYTVPVKKSQRQYLRFWWNNVLYQFTCLPNGLAEAPRKFTKLLKIPFKYLRERGHANSAYIDDSCLVDTSSEGCLQNVTDTAYLLDSLGFTVHPVKSCFEPTQVLVYLGFILNSLLMIVSLTADKAGKIVAQCKELKARSKCTIRECAQIVGKLVAAEPGVDYAPVHYKRMELEKTDRLQACAGDFEAQMWIPEIMKEDLQWWIDHALTAKREIVRPPPDIHVYSDSSGYAWGCIRDGVSAGGPWAGEEADWHINAKELMAAFLALKTLCPNEHGVHIRLHLDNTTSVLYVSKQGGKKWLLNSIARDLWIWAIERDIWVSAEHIPGVENIEADRASRKQFATETEWMLDPAVFIRVSDLFGPWDIDLFASRLNNQLPKYIAWNPDPGAVAIDAFTQTWHFTNAYVFPPFSLINRVLQQLQENQARATIIAPLWPGQVWFPKLLRLCTAAPVLLPNRDTLLQLPQSPGLVHPLRHKLHLTAFNVSARPYDAQAYQRTLSKWSSGLGGQRPSISIGRIGADGSTFVVEGRLIHCVHLGHK